MYYSPGFRTNENTNKRRRNIIRVIGEGSVTVQPDIAKITLGAATENKVLATAQQENANIITNIKNELRKIGIPEDSMQTIDYSIYPLYDFSDGKQVFSNYKVEHVLLITAADINNTGLVVDTAVNNGANIVRGITFDISEYSKYYQQALSLAVLNAGQKAETIANTLKVPLTKEPTLVAENTRESGGPIPFQPVAMVKSEASTPIQSSSMEIKSEVTAEFSY